ncbi:MAG: class III signal peptide-containing protein [Actinobacteria bacterium]|nr:class III signal peptide-containing protein [Actinomycetota bacterium]
MQRAILRWVVVPIHCRLASLSDRVLDDRGQTTAEYVLLILGAATIAILVTSWATGTDRVTRLFDRVLNSLISKVG